MDPRLEPGRRLGIELPAHQVGPRLDHDHVDAESAQRVGRLEPEQAADDGASRALGPAGQVVQIAEGAVDEHAFEVGALDGGEDQAAVAGLPAGGDSDELPFAVDGVHPGCGAAPALHGAGSGMAQVPDEAVEPAPPPDGARVLPG